MESTYSADVPFRAGIVGTGFLGKAMGREFLRHDRATVGALTELDPDVLVGAADELDVPEGSRYEDYERMLDEEDLDGLVITTPHGLHHEQIVAGLEHDLHVLCEKPLCTSLDDAKDLARRVERSDRTVMLGYQRHLDTAFRTARDYWSERETSPEFVTAELTQNWINAVGGSWKANADLSGGGQLYDSGSHVVDAVLWVMDETPSSVTAQMTFHDDDERIDIQAGLTVQFENGCVATIAVSGDAPRVSEAYQFWGEAGATLIDGHEWNPRRFRRVDSDGDIHAPNLNLGSELPKADAFIEAIETDGEPPATVHDGLLSTAVTEAAYESAWTGERIDVDLDY
ncbi:Gfo/Idh/MocA family protein [Halegenticoccus tardaugens]|uniref:Gfo/Idh/MocA family protein n=1 Tax=Halegenticoccus tardaugens TaxID=2071624 RepID=UPI00100A8BE7|nr:Gfo/Idh/MocA family oxidoreductase [Halegenticoccus tardaugens]